MQVFNCWCHKASPIILLHKYENLIVWECLMCHGTITVCLNPGETWKERSCDEPEEK